MVLSSLYLFFIFLKFGSSLKPRYMAFHMFLKLENSDFAYVYFTNVILVCYFNCVNFDSTCNSSLFKDMLLDQIFDLFF